MEEEKISVDMIAQQNKLLQEQNELLRERNKLLRQAASINQKYDREIFIENIDHDEMREGFLVTSHRKKLWNVEIGLLQEFARICKKHNIRWFAIGGTLLGAARHKGFIPWDDDVDVIMFRPEYEKFKSVVEEELKYNPNYSMWYWYNHRLESDSEAAQHVNTDLPLISRKYAERYSGLLPFFPMLRLIDERTTCFISEARKDIFYAIWIDIFCFDPCPPFEDDNAQKNFDIAKELFYATIAPDKVRQAVQNKENFLNPYDTILSFLNLPYKMRAQQLDRFLAKNYFESPYVSELAYQTIRQRRRAYKAKSFKDVVYLPFETIEIPAPADYDATLTDDFGDWHKMIRTDGHLNTYSVDIPYKEYFAQLKSKK